MSELESLASRASQLASKVDFWNSAVLWALLVTALAAAAIVFSQRLAFIRAKQLADVQDSITRIKEGNAKEQSDKLDQANLALRTDLEKEIGKVAGLQRDAADAKAAQQRVETDLAKQQERAAIAEKALLELQERVKWRTITPKQKKQFIDLTEGIRKGPIDVTAMDGDPESVAFAKQLADMLLEAGWNPTLNSILPIGSTPVGLDLLVRSKAPVNAASPLFHAAALGMALEKIGIPAFADENPNLPADKVVLMVGHKP